MKIEPEKKVRLVREWKQNSKIALKIEDFSENTGFISDGEFLYLRMLQITSDFKVLYLYISTKV